MPAHARPVNMMFQSYALFPHMTRRAERRLRPDQRGDVAGSSRRDRVREMLDLVQLGGLGGRKPHQISGGQRQRVALARALARAPKLLLLDEPLAALDKKLREHTQFELAGIQYRTGVTFVVVTHDQEEAMTLANRIAVMDRGRIRQVGTPTEIYEYPKTRFVADFIGSINMFDGSVVAADGAPARVDLPEYRHGRRPAAIPGLAAGQRDHAGGPPREDRDHPRAARRAERRRGRRRGSRLLRQGLALPRPPRLGPRPLGALDQRPPRRRARARPVGGPGLARLRPLRRDPAAGGTRCVSGLRALVRHLRLEPHDHRRALSLAAGLLPAAVPDRRRDVASRPGR